MSSNFEPSITDEMRARYLERRKADLAQLREALATTDFQTMKAIAHNIKGNAATFSYDDLEALSVRLETFAAESNRTGCEETTAAMTAWLEAQR